MSERDIAGVTLFFSVAQVLDSEWTLSVTGNGGYTNGKRCHGHQKQKEF
jgi:hypothetical protein